MREFLVADAKNCSRRSWLFVDEEEASSRFRLLLSSSPDIRLSQPRPSSDVNHPSDATHLLFARTASDSPRQHIRIRKHFCQPRTHPSSQMNASGSARVSC